MQVRYYTGVLHFMQLLFFLKKLLINQIGKSNLLGELAVFNISSLNPFVNQIITANYYNPIHLFS